MLQTENSLTQRCPLCGKALRLGSSGCVSCFLRLGFEEPDTSDAFPPLAAGEIPAGTKRYFGDYEILREVGRGGTGIVYEARQPGPQRIVALKLLAAGALATREAVHRFHTEAKAAALLEHSNVVPVYEAGAYDGQYFLAMRFMPGGTLADLAAVSPRKAAEATCQIALAVQYAHERGILHRDLKPGNILLDSAGTPHVTDFGLARLTHEQTVVTLSGAVLGTAAYMAPEQATGGTTTTASDIYSLGAILYQLLTGRPPFQKPTLHATLRAIVEENPRAPAITDSSESHSADLQTICLKCLEKDPGKRYATSQELADDLTRFLNNEPIKARPLSRSDRCVRWAQRNPALASSLLLVFLLLLLLLLGSPIAAWRINTARKAEVAERERAEAATKREVLLRRHSEAASYTSDMNLAKQAWDEGNLRRAQELLRAHIPQSGQADPRGFEWRYLWKLCQEESLLTVKYEADDPPSRLTGTPAHHFVAAAFDEAIRLLDPGTGEELAQLSYPNPNAPNPYGAIALASANTNLIAGHRAEGLICLWDLKSRALLAAFRPFTNNAGALALSPDGTVLAAADRQDLYSTRLTVWDISARPLQPISVWSMPLEEAVPVLAFSPDGRHLAIPKSSVRESVIEIREASSGRLLTRIPDAAAASIATLAYSPGGELLAYSGNEGRISVWDSRRNSVSSFDAHSGAITSLSFSRDGQFLLSSGYDRAIRQWRASSGQPSGIWRQLENGLTTAVYSPSGTSIVSTVASQLKIWSLEFRPAAEFLLRATGWGWPAISPDGRWIVIATRTSDGSSAIVQDAANRSHRFELRFTGTIPQCPRFSPDGQLLALGDVAKEGVVGVWNCAAWTSAAGTLDAFICLTNNFEAASLSFSPDSKTLMVAGLSFPPNVPRVPSGATNRLAFWSVESRTRLNLLPNAGVAPTEWAAAGTAQFSPDGHFVAIGHRDGRVRLWDVQQQRLLHSWKEHGNDGWSAEVRFSRDSRWLASFSRGGQSAVLFDLARLTAPRTIVLARDDASLLTGAEFTADNKSLITSHYNGLIQFWNLETFRPALTLRHSGGPSVNIALSSDGNLLVSKDAQGAVKLWRAASMEEIPKTKN